MKYYLIHNNKKKYFDSYIILKHLKEKKYLYDKQWYFAGSLNSKPDECENNIKNILKIKSFWETQRHFFKNKFLSCKYSAEIKVKE